MTKKTIILLGFILTKFLLQYFLFNPQYDLQRDEYLHLDQANHLAWGYTSVPPVTSWISYLILILGNAVFWVKFFPALFGALTILVVWKTIEELKGNLYAMVLGSTCVLLSVLLRLNFLFQPNSLDVLCWTAFYFSLIRYFNKEKQKWLFIAAVIFAVGFLNKYNMVFLLIGLIPAVLLTSQRKIFAQRGLYAAIVFSLLLVSPNLYWQYANNFPVFHHLKELAETQLVNVNRWGFLREQVFYFIGALPVIISSMYALLCYEPLKKYKFFFWSLLFTLATFLYFRAKGYYAIGLYPVYIAIGSVFLGNILHTGWKVYLRPVILAVPVLFYVLLFRVFYTIEIPEDILKRKDVYQKLGLLHWEDGKDHALPQDFADMLGWKELALKIEAVYNHLPKGSQTLIVCDNYGQAGAINYYAKNKSIRAVSFNADYINWFNLEKKTDNFIRVKAFTYRDGEFKKTSPFFNKSFVADSVNNSFAREYKTTIFVFMEPKIDVNQRLKSEIEITKR
ncbi:glycosyltransferase family 39 protein [Pedobacter sp. AW31-3R]|uniref:glycosyltransferase family 39 protein n=1 Tax=Pedobacter sp. AW31-3R TaxID=3445781 RepID=UPI003FA11AEC